MDFRERLSRDALDQEKLRADQEKHRADQELR